MNKETVFGALGIGLEVAADISFIVCADNLYKKENRTKKDYFKWYALPIGLSTGSITFQILSGVEHKKDIAGLIASNAAIVAASKAREESTKKAIEKNTDSGTAAKIEQDIDDEDLEKLMIELDSAEENDEPVNTDIHWFYFPQLHIAIKSTDAEVMDALLKLNDDYQFNCRTSVSALFYYINKDLIDPKKDISWPFLCDKNGGWKYGWETYDNDPEAGIVRIETNQYSRVVKGKKATYIYFIEAPRWFGDWEKFYDDQWRISNERA